MSRTRLPRGVGSWVKLPYYIIELLSGDRESLDIYCRLLCVVAWKSTLFEFSGGSLTVERGSVVANRLRLMEIIFPSIDFSVGADLTLRSMTWVAAAVKRLISIGLITLEELDLSKSRNAMRRVTVVNHARDQESNGCWVMLFRQYMTCDLASSPGQLGWLMQLLSVVDRTGKSYGFCSRAVLERNFSVLTDGVGLTASKLTHSVLVGIPGVTITRSNPDGLQFESLDAVIGYKKTSFDSQRKASLAAGAESAVIVDNQQQEEFKLKVFRP